MIYKFKDSDENYLEVFEVMNVNKEVCFQINEDIEFFLDNKNLYNLIGALHSLQTKLNKKQ